MEWKNEESWVMDGRFIWEEVNILKVDYDDGCAIVQTY